jgi:hypothetical protein
MGNLRHLTNGTRNTDKSFHILVTGYQKRGIYDVEETTTGFGIYLRAFLEPFSAICLDYNTRAMGLCSSDHLSRVDVNMLRLASPFLLLAAFRPWIRSQALTSFRSVWQMRSAGVDELSNCH